MGIKDRLSITDVAGHLGITPRTIMRWEKAGKIRKSKRDWRGWRFYEKGDVEEIQRFYETAYDYEQFEKTMMRTTKDVLASLIIASLAASSIMCEPVYGATADAAAPQGVVESKEAVDIDLGALPAVNAAPATVQEGIKYTLGPDDIIQVEVRRHPEFSGKYEVNSEGKIEYKYIGDIIVTGLTKAQLNERLVKILSEYIIEPEVDVQILAYLSKVFYVVGEVGRPGKFYMKGDKITIREALVLAALPTEAAAMRRCRLITPDDVGKNNYRDVNVYKLLYEGDLTCNYEMKPGDVLYVPATAIAKMIRVISPVTKTVSDTAGAAGPLAAVAVL